jgi:hypothetical protein
MTKIDLDKVSAYLSAQESVLSGADQMRVGAQLEAIRKLK